MEGVKEVGEQLRASRDRNPSPIEDFGKLLEAVEKFLDLKTTLARIESKLDTEIAGVGALDAKVTQALSGFQTPENQAKLDKLHSDQLALNEKLLAAQKT